MLSKIYRRTWPAVLFTLVAMLVSGPANADERIQSMQWKSNQIDVVIALDVSSSMSGLIDSAKQRLWDIVNELGRAQPQPDLRIAILSYGNPSYGTQSGYVRIDQPFTRDLDLVNQTLFKFSTNGGDEYVARVVDTALNQLDWSTSSDALRVLFVAGNEGAHQDPRIPVPQVMNLAASRGIAVNTIYCGSDSDGDARHWEQLSLSTNGVYASINQDTAAVANIPTPMDQEITDLNEELNKTYVSYGQEGESFRENQLEQDKNVAAMSAPALASRAETKASALYKADSWDLVDAVAAGKEVSDIPEEELPVEMREMESEERAAYVAENAAKRQKIQGRIQDLAGQRQDYIKKERARQSDRDDKGLDEVMQEGLQTLAKEKGFTFTKES